ncbi:MAG: hypothetical protein DRP08_03825 [Candidatus Aenigmatarchaeota archaeon]|nr:MAG: hypothetical protein DRP08_03825 [Candidatus Aenigmarchaeota archaeon]
MSEQEWLTEKMRRALHHHLAAWSDGPGYRQACELSESYRHLLPKPVTASQLHGLRNVVGAASDPQEVKRFTTNQSQKAERRGDLELRDYWQAVGKALDELRSEVKTLWTAIGGDKVSLSKKPRQDAQNEIQMQLMRAFVQHLVAHSQYLSVK